MYKEERLTQENHWSSFINFPDCLIATEYLSVRDFDVCHKKKIRCQTILGHYNALFYSISVWKTAIFITTDSWPSQWVQLSFLVLLHVFHHLERQTDIKILRRSDILYKGEEQEEESCAERSPMTHPSSRSPQKPLCDCKSDCTGWFLASHAALKTISGIRRVSLQRFALVLYPLSCFLQQPGIILAHHSSGQLESRWEFPVPKTTSANDTAW